VLAQASYKRQQFLSAPWLHTCNFVSVYQSANINLLAWLVTSLLFSLSHGHYSEYCENEDFRTTAFLKVWDPRFWSEQRRFQDALVCSACRAPHCGSALLWNSLVLAEHLGVPPAALSSIVDLGDFGHLCMRVTGLGSTESDRTIGRTCCQPRIRCM